MPGNEFGDGVHNFFAQDSLSQVQHNSPVADINWPTSRGNMWAGSQRQIGVLSSNTKNYNLQNSDTGRGISSYQFNGQHGLNFTQPIPRPELAKSQSQSQQPNLNGYMYGNQFYQTRQDETNFPAVDTSSDQRNIASGGSSFFESQQWLGPEQQTGVSVRSEPSDSPVSGSLFGGQQVSHQQSNMLHSLQRQQSGINDMQQFQQQVMFMKMQELQRQQQLHPLEARQQNTLSQVSSCPKVLSDVHSSALVNGTANSGAVNHSWANELGNTNWSQRGSLVLQGSSNGLIPTVNGQAQHLMGLVPQQIDQSLYGVPVSSSRPSLNQFSQGVTDKQAVQQMPTFNSSFPADHYTPLADQVGGQDGIFLSRQGLQVENVFGDAPSQTLSNPMDVGNLQQVDSMQNASALQEFRGRLDIAVPPETAQEEAAGGASPSQNEVGLDPTEERILFGSDDNIWAAFGKSPMSGEGGNPFDGAELLDGTPSIQGGTWSALMQSAVAETSSSDVGLPEHWTGLNFHSTEIPSGSSNLTYNSERHKTTYAEDNLPQASSMNSVSVQSSGSPNMRNSYHNAQGQRFPFEPGKNLQSNSSQRLVPSSDERNKWSKLGQSQMLGAGGCQMDEKTSNLDREMISKNISGNLAPEVDEAKEQYNKSAGWSIDESAMPCGDAVTASREHSSNSEEHNQNKFIQGEVHRGVGWNSNPGRNTTANIAHTESSVGSPQVNSEVSGLHNSAAVPNSSTMMSGKETSQFFKNNHQSTYWSNADRSVKSIVGKGEVLQHHVSEDNQLLHSSLDICEKEGKMHEMGNNDKQENSNDSHRSNLSRHSSAGDVRENVLSDARDARFLSTGKHKLYNEVGQRNSWANKFQHHPMGNVDKVADPTCGMRHATHSQPMLQQNAARYGQSLLAQVPNFEADLAKVHASDELTDGKGYGVHSGPGFPGGASNMSALINRSIGLPPNTAPKSSPDMLQLLQKVDPLRDRGSTAHFNNYEHKSLSDVPETENSDGSAGHLWQSQSSASQGFGLQLGPPSQQISVQTNLLSSQGPIEAVSSSHSSHSVAEITEKSQGQMLRPHQAQSLPSPSDLLQPELQHNTSRVPGSTIKETDTHTMSGNFSSAFESASGHTYSRNQLQNSHMVSASGRDSTDPSIGVAFDEHASHSTEKGDSGRGPLPDGSANIPYSPARSMGKYQVSNANGPHGSVSINRASSKESVSASPSFLMPGISLQGSSSKKLTNMRTNFPPPPHFFSSQYCKDPSHIPQPNQMNTMESSLSAPERQGNQDANKGGTFMSELGSGSVNSLHSVEGGELREKENTSEPVTKINVDLMQGMDDSKGGESVVKNLHESTSMQRDIEAFGRSLKPNSFPNQSYSLLNQMWTMKNSETSNMAFKRMMVPNSSAATQQVPSTDSRMQNYAGPDELQGSLSFQHGGRMTPHDVAFRQDEYQAGSYNSNTSSVKPEQTQISPHMAPLWFNQSGSFKNGQMLQVYDIHRAAAMKTVEQPFTPAKFTSGLYAFNSIQHIIHANADRSQIDNLGQSSLFNSAGTEHFSSLQTLPVSIDQQNPIMKPQKRKRSTYEFTPWYKEISLDLWSDQTISLSDIEWAKAVNRLTEKVKEIDSIDDGPPRLKARRRLMLTTQLTQQLFYPPPAAILSADTKSEYESVAYSISRLALGDACSLVSCSNADNNMPHAGKELVPDKCKASGRNDRHHFDRAVEELMGRARKLETDFVSLDKRASLLDMIVEGQDLEKFSVFYRFAKFHGRGQSNGAESSSTAAAAYSHRPFLQRYVTAFPMPQNLPDRVQCLSL